MYIVGRSSAHHYRIKNTYIHQHSNRISYIQESTYVYDDDDEKKRIEIRSSSFALLCFALSSAFSTYYHHHIIIYSHLLYILSLAVAIFSGCVF